MLAPSISPRIKSNVHALPVVLQRFVTLRDEARAFDNILLHQIRISFSTPKSCPCPQLDIQWFPSSQALFRIEIGRSVYTSFEEMSITSYMKMQYDNSIMRTLYYRANAETRGLNARTCVRLSCN
ncbi:hypothetical protein HAX54_006128 [Datura stramonium]|uniref:Uncharacterized protein n=1 Tax=Datura stramonium TaxID=4076 RepID=A0ABS8TAK1_DATST|nr:hypothetical protein [Datura stramonium]